MPEILTLNSTELLLISLLNTFLILILLIMNITTKSKLKKLKNKYNRFMNGSGDKNIEELLEEFIEGVNSVAQKNKDIENHINNIELEMYQCVKKVGIIRFNAFDNVGSDLSYAIAMLDGGDNGIVLSGIYARDSSSSYAKPIITGKSKYALSAEEIQAIDIAKKSSRERMYTEKQML